VRRIIYNSSQFNINAKLADFNTVTCELSSLMEPKVLVEQPSKAARPRRTVEKSGPEVDTPGPRWYCVRA
jgi:hypothetical protein